MISKRGRPATQRLRMLNYVRDTISAEGVAPSYGMICQELGTDRGTVRRMVCALEELGELRRVGAGKVRRLRLASMVAR